VIRRAQLTLPTRQLLQAQHGVLSRRQALATGLSPDDLRGLLESEALTPIGKGVYTSREDPEWRGLAWAGLLLGGTDAVIGREAAAHLHGLVARPPEVITVWIGRDRQLKPQGVWQFVRGSRRGRGEMARTSVNDTILDLADSSDDDELCRLMANAISNRMTTSSSLLADLARRHWQPKRALFRDILADVADGAMSPLERRYFRDVERAHRLPRGIRQAGALRYFSDIRYPQGLIVELDGRQYHRGPKEFDDMWRDNELSLDGALTFRFGAPHITGGACRTARLVGATLMRLGWPGPITRCPRCLAMPMDSW